MNLQRKVFVGELTTYLLSTRLYWLKHIFLWPRSQFILATVFHFSRSHSFIHWRRITSYSRGTLSNHEKKDVKKKSFLGTKYRVLLILYIGVSLIHHVIQRQLSVTLTRPQTDKRTTYSSVGAEFLSLKVPWPVLLLQELKIILPSSRYLWLHFFLGCDSIIKVNTLWVIFMEHFPYHTSCPKCSL